MAPIMALKKIKKKIWNYNFYRHKIREWWNYWLDKKLKYKVEMAKEGKKILRHVIEKPTNNVVGKFFFEEDANHLSDFQNEHRVWQENGGIPKFLWNYSASTHS